MIKTGILNWYKTMIIKENIIEFPTFYQVILFLHNKFESDL